MTLQVCPPLRTDSATVIQIPARYSYTIWPSGEKAGYILYRLAISRTPQIQANTHSPKTHYTSEWPDHQMAVIEATTN